MIRGLYNMTLDLGAQDLTVEGFKADLLQDLYSPTYIHRKTSSKISRIKKNLDIDFNFAKTFFEQNPEYVILKPNCIKNLIPWMKSMYFNSSFTQAYSTITRAQLTLRLSFYASKKCIKFGDSILNIKDYQSALQTTINIKQSEVDEQTLLFTLTVGDTNTELFFEITQNLAIITDEYKEPELNTVNMLPNSYAYLNFENSSLNVIQYVLSPENFELDLRVGLKTSSLERDKDLFLKTFGTNITTQQLRVILKEMAINTKKPSVGLTYSARGSHFDEFVLD
jgi:hypothetical protein